MSNLLKHAERELTLIGYDGKDEYNNMVKSAIMELIATFAKQGHSGFSAPYVINVVTKLAKFEVLSPLTGADDEWNDVSDGLWQNNRDSAVFKAKDGCYFINAFVWVDKETCGYTNKKSRGYIKSFPFIPKTFHINVDDDGNPINQAEMDEASKYYAG
jgi:hypothetical protein